MRFWSVFFLVFFLIGVCMALGSALLDWSEETQDSLRPTPIPFKRPPLPVLAEGESLYCSSLAVDRIRQAIEEVTYSAPLDICNVAREVLLAANAHDLDPFLLVAIIQTESSWRSDVVSHAGAIGYMQVMPATFIAMGGKDIWDWRQNIHYGAKYFAYLLRERANDDMSLALMYYNAGPSRGPVVARRLSSAYAGKALSYYERVRR